MKKVLIFSASARLGGNSDTLCDLFAQGAVEAGHQVEKIRLAEKNIHFCLGCGVCNTTHACVQEDDMADILEKMVQADVLVFATPVYFYAMNGQMKTLIDRTVPRYQEIANKDVYYIITAADTDKEIMDKVINSFRGFTLDCLPNARERGIIYGLGAWQMGDIQQTGAVQEAYNMGKAV